VGTTPGTFFVNAGEREFELRRPGFEPARRTVRVRGRLVGSWIFPRTMTVRLETSEADADELVRAAGIDFASWSLTGEASGQYQFPPIARRLAADLRAVGGTDVPIVRAAWDAFADDAVAQISSEALLNDYLAGALSMGGETAVAVPAGISSTIQNLARRADESSLMPLQVLTLASPEREAALADGEWIDAGVRAARGLADVRFQGAEAIAGRRRAFPLGLSFVELPGGDVVLGGAERATRGGDIPYRASLEPFSVGLTEVPFSAFQAFLEANPLWQPENRGDLIDAGVVDDAYLAEIEALTAEPQRPATGISAYAAEAFAAWYTDLLPSGLQARLPSEAEWAFALRVSGSQDGVLAGPDVSSARAVSDARTGAAGLTGMVGNVWEWTADSFAPYAPVYSNAAGREGRPGGAFVAAAAHRTVRGGGWATDPVGFDPADRGSLDPAWCSPFVGFRLVVSPSGE
jgi:formylglycine-generating enzyme required for sulfatase activity